MSTEQNKQLVRRYYAEVVSGAKVNDLADFLSADYAEIHNNKRYDVGIEGAKEHILGVHETYRNLQISVERQIAEGDWVVTQITARGTHVRAWLGMKPTGKNVEFTGVNVDRVVGGRIVEHGGAANMLEPLLDIGAVRIVAE
jgi:predicted ester cyclase